jgi:predicted phosphodiesterase
MRIAVFSDMHGNAVALDAMLADLRQQPPVDHMVCLGDAIQGGPQPAQVVARLRELGCPVVMGNADDWLLTGEASDAEQISSARQMMLNAVRDWMLATQLSEDDRAFIATFQPTVEIALDGERTLLCFHGSPRSFDEIILPLTPDDEVREYLQPQQTVTYTGGHTHVQFMRHFGRTFHFNPGSVGFAYRHSQPEGEFRADPWAEYAILTAEPLALEFRRVPFDVETLIETYRSSGRPYADEAIAQYQA